jgi:preprotein translocase subunit YajC
MIIAYALVFAIIIFMVWTTYNQQRRAKRAQEELVRMLKRGDEVVTIGGMFGTIRKIGDEYVVLEVEDGSRVRFLKRAIREIVSEEDDDDEYDDEDYDEIEDESADEDDDGYEDDDDEGEEELDDDDDDESASDDDIDAPEPPSPPEGVKR